MSIQNVLLAQYHFVYTYYYGSIDDIQVRAYADKLKAELREFKTCCEIINFSRDADFSKPSSETLNPAGALEKERPNAGTGPLAILVRDPLTYGLARTDSAFASDSRTGVLISYDIEKCLAFMCLTEHQSLQIKNAISLPNAGAYELSSAGQLQFKFPV